MHIKKASNIYKLDGKVPLLKAIPFGLQHIISMFMANITPVILICAVSKYNGIAFNSVDTTMLVQSAMIIAGISTIIQLYPVWKIGSKLPIVMGISFTFVPILLTLASKDYGIMLGAIIVGGLIEGFLGLTAKYWKRFIKPVVSASVVITIGFSLLNVGITSFISSNSYEIGSLENIIVATITLISALLFNRFAKGNLKQLYILFGLIIGYITSIFFGMVNFNEITETIKNVGIISLPKLFQFQPKFDLNAIISVALIFLVSATETIGDTTAICNGALKRDVTDKEISGSLACDGILSSISAFIFNCPPITSFSQNVGLISITKVVNRFTIMIGALILIIAGFFPPIGAFLATIPDCVLGGATIIMFGSIIVSGIQMLAKCELEKEHNMIIVATSLSIGIGVTLVNDFFKFMPQIIKDIFAGNPVATVFIISLILSLLLKEKKAH